MAGRPLRGAAGREDLLGRASMREDAVRGLDRLVDGRAHDGVRELDVGRSDAQQVAADERGRGVACDLEVEARELGDVAELGAVAEHRSRTREAGGLGGQPREPKRHRPRDRFRPDLQDPVGIGLHRRQAFAGDRREQRPQEERIAARGPQTRLGERALGLASEPLGGKVGDRFDPERGRPDQHRCRVRDQLGQQLDLLALLRRPQPDHDRERQALEATGKIREPTQRGPVGPVEIVDRDHQRSAEGDIRRKPVQAVQHPERDIAAVRDQLGLGEQTLREGGGAGKELATLIGPRRGDQRLEQLPQNTVGEVLLELGAPGEEDLEAGAALDRHQASATVGGEADDGLDRCQLGVALEQRRARRARFRGRRSLLAARTGRRERVLQAR